MFCSFLIKMAVKLAWCVQSVRVIKCISRDILGLSIKELCFLDSAAGKFSIMSYTGYMEFQSVKCWGQ